MRSWKSHLIFVQYLELLVESWLYFTVILEWLLWLMKIKIILGLKRKCIPSAELCFPCSCYILFFKTFWGMSLGRWNILFLSPVLWAVPDHQWAVLQSCKGQAGIRSQTEAAALWESNWKFLWRDLTASAKTIPKGLQESWSQTA